MTRIAVKNLYKIFGPHPRRKALPMLEKGHSKGEILEKTGCTVGVDNASFEVREREIFVIMGLSGSGKSTVLRCLNRLIEPTSGEIHVDGENIVDADTETLRNIRRKKMSMVFQHFGLLPHRTVLSNVAYGLEIRNEDVTEREKKAQEATELVGLAGYEQSFVSELSGGMQQRVGLARALATDPEILLMDEAFSALDPLIRAQLQDELLDIQAQMHKSIVFITHDLDEALKLGDRIAIMKDGAIVQVGTSEEILTDPATEYVENFVENVDRTRVITARTIMRKPAVIVSSKDGPKAAVRQMEQKGVSTLYVQDAEHTFQGTVDIEDAIRLRDQDKRDLSEAIQKDVPTTKPDTPIIELLEVAHETRVPIAVIGEKGELLGIVSRASILGGIAGVSQEAKQ